MKYQFKPLFWAVIAAAVIGIILVILGVMAMIVILSSLVGAVVAFILSDHLQKSRAAQPEAQRAAAQKSAATAAEKEVEKILSDLISLTLVVRGSGLVPEVSGKFDAVCDGLYEVMPGLNARDDVGEQSWAWAINRIGSQFLPRIMNEFIALSPESRSSKQGELIRLLDGLLAQIETVKAELKKGSEHTFDSAAAFINAFGLK